jgi:hypothetical protein
MEIPNDSVIDSIAPSVNAQLLPSVPGILNNARVAHVLDGTSHVELTEQVCAGKKIWNGLELVLVDVVEIFDRAEPVVQESVLLGSEQADKKFIVSYSQKCPTYPFTHPMAARTPPHP